MRAYLARRFEAILEQATDLEDRIAMPVLLTEPSPGHEAMDFGAVSARFSPIVGELRAAVDAFQDQRRVVQLRRVDRDELKERYGVTFLWVARIFESLFMLAGLERLASYVRPSTRRPGTTVQVSGPDNPTSDGPGTLPADDAGPDSEDPDDDPDGDEPDGDEPDGDEPGGDEPDGDPDVEP